MDNTIKQHQSRIFTNHMRRTSNLLKLGRYAEAKADAIRFAGIVALWEIQELKEQERAVRGLAHSK